MAWAGIELIHGGYLDDFAQIHDRNPVAHVPDNREVMRNENVGQPELLLKVGQQVENLRLDRNVQSRDGLVRDDQLGSKGQGAGDADALPLATRELGGEPVVVFGVEADQAHQLLHLALALVAATDPMDCERVAYDRSDPAAGGERADRVLENHLNALTQGAHSPPREPRNIVPVKHDLSSGEIEQAGDASRQS